MGLLKRVPSLLAAGCDAYRTNQQRYEQDPEALEQDIHQRIATIPESWRTVVVVHHAFRYFEEACPGRVPCRKAVPPPCWAAPASLTGTKPAGPFMARTKQHRSPGAPVLFLKEYWPPDR